VKNKTRASTVRALAIAAICAGAAAAVYSQRSAIGQGLHNVRDLDWVWVAAASLAEVLSILALALLYRALLQASQARLILPWILASSYTANAISTAVPMIGPGTASRQAYRQFRQRGADPAAASLTLTLAGIVSTATLATVVTAAAVLSGNPAASASGLLAAAAMLAAAVAVAAELRSEGAGTAPATHHFLSSLLTTGHTTQGPGPVPRPDGPGVGPVAAAGGGSLGPGTAVGLVNWWADAACLAFAALAAGITGLSAGKIPLVGRQVRSRQPQPHPGRHRRGRKSPWSRP
jgi:uncharacterized membrane protein YbhN (UPF0104 family)